MALQYFFLIYSSLLGRVVTGDVLQAEPGHYLVLLSFVLHGPLTEVQKYKGALVFLALTQYGYHCLDGFDMNRYLILFVSVLLPFGRNLKRSSCLVLDVEFPMFYEILLIKHSIMAY